MDEFAILTNRRRAIIALLHSVVFWLLASQQMIGTTPAQSMLLPPAPATLTWVLCGIYGAVSAILLWLFAVSRSAMERVYFALCVASATSGLLRTILGDHGFHSGRYIRVVMLTSAAVVGVMIVRAHSGIPGA